MKHQATPYFTFDGQGEEALAYYTQVFEGEVVEKQTFGEADFPTPPDAENRILHARFKKGNLVFMVSDTFPDQPVVKGNHMALVFELNSEVEIQSLYDKLSEEGSVLMELQDTFWDAKYAKVKDPFDVIWDLNFSKSK
ncbi:VOC family protein [Alteribacter aurantiacus]|uniref:VOC family protein n=1 Tax=Alteribacter aurantiacus TaxID=254410 RepID=UPI000413A26E|nr:VOC family protein [Alteribacter aurantiacus]